MKEKSRHFGTNSTSIKSVDLINEREEGEENYNAQTVI